jgi:hypothetical protein
MMTKVAIPELSRWIAAEGADRNRAIQEAAEALLHDYSRRWMHLLPVELHRLGANLHAEIVKSENLKKPDGRPGEAILLPVCGGFRVLVSSAVSLGRQRASIAHELVHTLFYDVVDGAIPIRRIAHAPREEHFCFDVARHILVPRQHLEAIGAFLERRADLVMGKLTDKLLLSRPWAARVILADYALAKGIAGRWKRTELGWEPEYGSSSASPDIKERDRREMRSIVGKWLNRQIDSPCNLQITCIKETSGEGVFILAVKNT